MDESLRRKIERMGKAKALEFAIQWVRANKIPCFDAKAGHISSNPRASRKLEEVAVFLIEVIFLQKEQEDARREQEGR